MAFDSVEQKQSANLSLHHQLLSLNPYEPQNLSKVLGRMNKIRDFEWSSADVQGTLAATISLPSDLFKPPQSTITNVPLLSRLAGYRYFRAAVKLRMTINATLFHSGKLMFVWMPHYRQGVTIEREKNQTIYQASNNRPLIMDATSNSSLVMDIPWIVPTVWLDLIEYATQVTKWDAYIGTVDMWILHPLENASASAPSPSKVNVSIEAAFVDAEVSGYEPVQLAAPFNSNEHASCQMEVFDKTIKGVVAGVKEEASHLRHTVQSIPIVGDAISSTLFPIFDGLGLNKPTSIGSSQMVNLQLAPDFTHGEGLDYSNKLSFDPGNKIATSPSIYSEGDDMMDIYKIARTPSLRLLKTFTSALAQGDIVHTECCDPMLCSPEVSLDGDFAPTYVSYVSFPFHFYSGGLKYFLQFTAPKTVTCKLRLSWTPTEITSTDQFAYLGGEFPSRIVDITGSTQTEFTTPFLSPYPMLPVSNFIRDTNPVFSNFMNSGFWQLSILNPVITSTGETATVHLAIWKSAAEDYRLYKPREIMNGFEEGVKEESDDDFAEVQCDIWDTFRKTFTPILPVNYINHQRVTSGESVSSLRTLMHRYVYMHSVNGSTVPINYNTVPFPGTLGAGLFPNQHWYWLQLFYYWKGSLRFKMLNKTNSGAATRAGLGRVVLNTTNTPVVVSVATPWNTFGGSIPYNTEYKPAIEFEVPWFYPNLFATVFPINSPISPVPPDARVSIPGFSVFQVQTNGADALVNGPGYDVFIAVGDDFSMGFLSAPPMVVGGVFQKQVTTTCEPRKLTNRNLSKQNSNVSVLQKQPLVRVSNRT